MSNKVADAVRESHGQHLATDVRSARLRRIDDRVKEMRETGGRSCARSAHHSCALSFSTCTKLTRNFAGAELASPRQGRS
jgi:hypothetical protein